MNDIDLIYLVPAVGAVVIVLCFFFLRKKKPSPAKEAPDSRASSVEPVSVSGAESKVVPKAEVAPTPKDMRSLLSRTRDAFSSKIDAFILNSKHFDKEFLDSLEELLYTGDLGPLTVEKLLTAIRGRLSRGELSDPVGVKKALYDEVIQILRSCYRAPQTEMPHPCHVILVVGVNGVGKTTSIGKLAHFFSLQNKKVLIVAGDTFRAAAAEQLAVWGERAQVEVYSSTQTKDPAAIAFEGMQRAVAEKKDIVIVDTAGRLHTKEGLMEELKKVKRVLGKSFDGAPHEILLVIDANSGQNALIQAKLFHEALSLSGLIVTKLDGSARGGVIVGIASEVGVGVNYIGLGEKISDLALFSPDDYAKGLLQI